MDNEIDSLTKILNSGIFYTSREYRHAFNKLQSLGFKLCTKCRKTKPLEQFFASKNRASQRATICSDCSSQYTKQYIKTPSGKASVYSSQNRIPAGDVQPWFEEPLVNSPCWMCGGQREGRMALDHDHKNKTIRGWAHYGCNVSEGLILNSPNPKALLKSLSKIVKEYNKTKERSD